MFTIHMIIMYRSRRPPRRGGGPAERPRADMSLNVMMVSN